jgi:hypothetical protein
MLNAGEILARSGADRFVPLSFWRQRPGMLTAQAAVDRKGDMRYVGSCSPRLSFHAITELPTMKHLLVTLLLLVSASLIAPAQYVGPPPRTLMFRLYGRGARPITEKDSAYRVSVQLWDPYSDTTVLKKYEMPFTRSSDSLRFTTRGQFEAGGYYVMRIDSQGRSMNVLLANGPESLEFVPGDYLVSALYQPLFAMRKGKGVDVVPKFTDFKVGSLEDVLLKRHPQDTEPTPMSIPCRQMNGNAGVLAGEDPEQTRMNITNIALVPNGAGVIAAVQHGEWERRATLARTTDRGTSWKSLPYPFPKDTILALSFSSSRDGIIYGMNEKLDRVVSITTNGGQSWKRGEVPADFDSEVERLAPNADRIRIDSMTIFRLVRESAENIRLMGYSVRRPSATDPPTFSETLEAWKNRALEKKPHLWDLLKSSNGGATWDTLLSGSNEAVERIRFFDKSHGVLMTNEYMMITRDQGRSWRYQPFTGAWGGAQGAGPCGPFILQDFIFVDERTLCEFFFAWIRFIPVE